MPTKEHHSNSSKVYLPKLSAESLNNQSHFQHNYLQEYLFKQHKQNEQLMTLWYKFQEDLIEKQKKHLQHFNEIDSKLELNDSATKELLTKITDLDNETSTIEAQLDTLILLAEEQKELTREEFNQLAADVKTKITETETNYQHIAEKLDLHEIFQQTLLESMKETTGSVNKISRQLDHLKEVIFERVHYLAEKIENNIKSISQPIQRFFVSSEKDETIKK
ncbi:hypothetical protein CHH62_01175 [Niallia circulans]|uniref:hypothetical protein n=1 Tax=Niallia circulans TaxID=1397 RepID=UPI000BA51AFF|nr:hypothetical protein [Niallia circulans]PAD27702.1 hypothetical protein CHH62_01175 [Niallia circulans]